MNKLIVCVMGDNCSKFLDICFESVLEADKIIFCWGMEDQDTLNKFYKWNDKYRSKFELIYHNYNQNDLGMNGKQRNFYLSYLKENYPEELALCLDADEVVDDLSKIKTFIQIEEEGIYSVHMRHLINDLAHEDTTVDKHWVLNRLFKISEASGYLEVEHPVLQGNVKGNTDCTVIWHLAYCSFIWDIKKRYENHLKKSNMHTPKYLREWYLAHLTGSYPRKQFDIMELPKSILNEFLINKDEIYFRNRNIELKHPIMVKQWHDFFKPESVLDLGCGKGPFLYFWQWFVNKTKGIELSQYAINNAFCPNIEQGDISDMNADWGQWDLITAIDILEHLDEEQLDRTLMNILKYGKRFIFSIPFIGDPNLMADKSHKLYKTKSEWIEIFEVYGFKISDAPSNWLYVNQLLIGEKNG